MFYALSYALKFEQNVGCFVWGGKNGMGCFVREGGGQKQHGMFCPGGKSLPDVLSGLSKIAWDVLSQNVLSSIP